LRDGRRSLLLNNRRLLWHDRRGRRDDWLRLDLWLRYLLLRHLASHGRFQERLVEGQRRRLSIFRNRDFGRADFIRPLDAGEGVSVLGSFGGKILLEILVRARSDCYEIAVLRVRGVRNVKVLRKIRGC